MATDTSVRSRRSGFVSNIIDIQCGKYKKTSFHFIIFAISCNKKNARHKTIFHQKLGKSSARVAESMSALRHYLSKQKKLKPKETRKNKIISINALTVLHYSLPKSITGLNRKHDESYKLLMSGDVEENPGPNTPDDGGSTNNSPDPRVKSHDHLEVITYNCRGLKEYKKLKRVINTFAGIIKKRPLSIMFLQETHLGTESINKIKVMWRGNFTLSPGEGGSRGCITLIDKRWVIEEQFESLDGRMACTVMSCEQLAVIAINVYAPNDHDISCFDALFDKLLELKDKYPEHMITAAGDLNIVLDQHCDSINRQVTKNELISSKLVRDNLRVLELVDSFRKIESKGGYTWTRGNVFSRLDYIITSKNLGELVTKVRTDWAFDKSDHAAVIVTFSIPKINIRGPGLIRVNADILKVDHVKSEFLARLNEGISDIPASWDPHKRLEFVKVLTRGILAELAGKEKRVEEIEFLATCDQLNRLKTNYANNLEINKVIPHITEAITELQEEVDRYLNVKADKLAERAKCTWFHEGEKSNKYFLNLLKRRKNETCLRELIDGEEKAYNQKDIEKLVVGFYSKLYDEDKSLKQDYDSFFPELPRLNDDERMSLDKPISLEELRETLNGCKESCPAPARMVYRILSTRSAGKYLVLSYFLHGIIVKNVVCYLTLIEPQQLH